MTEQPGAEAVGGVAEEAVKLLVGVQDWARRAFGEAAHDADHREGAGHSSECAWCPLCRVVSLLRGEHPETTEKLVAAGTMLLSGLQSWLESNATAAGGGAEGDPPRPARSVQRIDLGGE